jgi:NADPH-dependent ferric siderophore reductase
MSLHDLLIHPLVVRTVAVDRVEDLTPRMRRVVLRGEQLGSFTQEGITHPAFEAPGFDDHVKLIFAQGGPLGSALPRQLPDGIEWTDAPHRAARDYTPRRVDHTSGELVLDFVLHGEGPAAGWARSARPGDSLSFVGPKSSLVLPPDVSAVVLIGDETALPAIARVLDERPVRVPAHVVILAADQRAQLDLAVQEEDTLRWELMPTPDGDRIAQLFTQLTETVDLGAAPYLWAAGEARSLLPLRRAASGTIPRDHRSITGYWHEELTEAVAAAPSLPGPPLEWMAIRAALRTGLLAHLGRGPASPADLAAAAGIPFERIRLLLDVLVGAGLVTAATSTAECSGEFRLADLGADLLEDEHEQDEFVGLEAELVLSLSQLPAGLTSSSSPWELTHGETLTRSLAAQPPLLHALEHASEQLAFLQHGLFAALDALPVSRIQAIGPAATTIAQLTDRAGRPPLEAQGAQAIVSALAITHRTDEEALAHLHGLHEQVPHVLLLSAQPDAIGAGAQKALLDFAATGAPPRSVERLSELAQDAGWAVEDTHLLGWGFVALRLRRAER